MKLLLLIAVLASSKLEVESIEASLKKLPYDEFYIDFDVLSTSNDTVAWGTFDDEIYINGWSYLEIKTFPHFSDEDQAYGAGYLEAVLTYEKIFDKWRNTVQHNCDDQKLICELAKDFVQQNNDWIQSQFQANCPDNGSQECDPYWHQVKLVYLQLKGIRESYEKLVAKGIASFIPPEDIYLMNIQVDMDDLSQALAYQKGLPYSRVLGSGSCSALIKLIEDDIFTSHVTWAPYNDMIRILKKYDMFAGQGLPGQVISFSGYPGLVYSGDDFHLMKPSKLSSIETTIANYNPDLFALIKPKNFLFTGFRTMVANRLANSGKEWTDIFALYNSGTYNNEWMIVDYKKFNPINGGIDPEGGLLWVSDQLPGHIHSEDMTEYLINKTYFSSFNVPFFPDIFNLSDNQQYVDEYGNWWTHDLTPRALIFERDQINVYDMDTMTRLMRSNDFQHDPLAACNCTPPYSAENAISARCDLNPIGGTYPFDSLGHRAHGGTDMKTTSTNMINQLEFVAISSQTYQDVPAFQWSKSDFNDHVPHHGHPDLWNFGPVIHKWKLP